MCVVSAELFYKDPKAYLLRAKNETVTVVTDSGSFSIIDNDELERLEVEAGIAAGEAEIMAGNFLTLEQFNEVIDAKLAEARARLSE